MCFSKKAPHSSTNPSIVAKYKSPPGHGLSGLLSSVVDLAWARAACFASAIAVHDPAFGQIVWRHFEIHAVARQNLDAVAAEPTGDVREDFVPVLELDGERGAREDLFDRPENFNRALFIGLLRRLLGRFDPAGSLIRTAGSYDFTCFNCMALVYRTRQASANPFGRLDPMAAEKRLGERFYEPGHRAADRPVELLVWAREHRHERRTVEIRA